MRSSLHRSTPLNPVTNRGEQDTRNDGRYAAFDAVRRNLRGQHPVLTKSANNPIFTLGDQGSTFASLQWPQIVNVVQETGAAGPHGETYGIFYCTDHETTTSRIGYMYLAADKSVKAAVKADWHDIGSIYQDVSAGLQTETQWVVYNPVTALWHMYYHKTGATASGAEVTELATSPDLTTWTRVGPVLDWNSSQNSGFPDAGSFGYFRPFRIGARWYGHSLLQGTNYARFGFWQSSDGIEWILDPRPLANGTEVLGRIDRRINWNQGTVIAWNGEYWWVGLQASYNSGGGATTSELIACRITSDFRQLSGKPVLLFPTLQAWENGDNRGGCALVDTDGSLIYVYTNTTNGSAPHVTGIGLAAGV